MREIGRGEEGTTGVTVAAAVAILERQPEEQRRDTARPRLGEKVAFLQSRFGGANAVPSKSKYSEKSPKSDYSPKNKGDLAEVKKEEQVSEVVDNHVVENEGACFNDIRKSSSTKNLSALIHGSPVISSLNNVTLSPGESKKSHPSITNSEIIIPDSETSIKPVSKKLSNQLKPPSKIACEVQRSSSSKEAVDHKICDYSNDGLKASFGRLHPDTELHSSVSDSNIPRKRPRVIHLRDSTKDGRPKSSPEAPSGAVGCCDSNETHNSSLKIVLEYPPPPTTSPPSDYDDRPGSALTGDSSPVSTHRMVSTDSLDPNASGKDYNGSDIGRNIQHTYGHPARRTIIMEDALFSDPNASDDIADFSDEEYDDSGEYSISSWSGSGIHNICSDEGELFPEQGGDESSPDEEEDSTLKCSGTAWSGSDSATHHRSSSTSDFSSSSSEDEAEDLDHPSRISSRPSEDLNTTGCDEDFQWIHSSNSGDMENRRKKRNNISATENRTVEVCTPESDDSRCNNDDLDYDPPQIMKNQENMTPSYEKVTNKTEMQTSGNDRFEYRPFTSENSEVIHRKPPRHDLNSKPPISSFDKASSLDRRRHHSQSRASRDQKARSSIILQSPRYRSPSRRGTSPSPSECRHFNNSCLMNHGVACCDSATSLLHCSNSHEYLHQPIHTPHCCSSTSIRDDLMSASYDSSFAENHHHHHHHGDLQRYGSAGKLDCHIRMCHGSQQDLVMAGDCCGGDCYGSRGYLPLCNCQAEQRCRWRHICKQPPGSSDVEERLRRLEADKDSLQLQVTVLTEQIEVQTDKIADLEKLLDEKKRLLASAEDELQREMLSHSSLETQKLELLSAMSELKLQQAALERDNLDLRDRLGEERRRNKPPVLPRAALLVTSTPVGSQQTTQLLGSVSPSPSPVSSLSEGSPRRLGNHPNSVEDFKDIPAPRTPPANYRRKVEHYGSLPRQRAATNGTAVSPMDGITPPGNAPGMRKGVAFAETERVVIDDATASPLTEIVAEEEVDGTTELSPQPSPSFQVGKSKGIKKIFGKMKRSGSGNLDDLLGEGEFRRGGVRATAGPRLGWTNQPLIKQQKSDQPFAQWDSDAISRWLQELGLDCYAGDAKRWVKTGAQLLQASNHELEKELGIKNPLHRKKLHLALLSQQENMTTLDPHLTPSGELDTAWVLRWLDDAGLPQHKETFLAARVDGRVLHRLTMDDLATLHVTSHLHVASLRRGIQVLRDHKFEANCLKRRSLPDDPAQSTAQEVALWTNHRVMEWLRVVDLAEYAPNLRGSGVHGGLMVHEPRFTAELLASLLSIPPSKTLLRRHLNTHFKELLGRDCIQEKREAEATLGYIPLSATTKVKITKKSQFTLKRKKSKSDLDFGDLVCPLDPNKSGEAQPLGDGMMWMESLPPRVVAVCHEIDGKYSVEQLKTTECKLPERTSNV